MAGGNVWISAGGGLVFGPTSRVDVGGLLATTARIDDVDFIQSGLSGANNDFHFDDAGAPISILGGANIEGHGGVLAFIATDVDQHHGPSSARSRRRISPRAQTPRCCTARPAATTSSSTTAVATC